MTTEPKTAVGYMCKTDWDEHVPDDYGGWRVYPSMESLKSHAKCTTMGCGVVKVSMKLEQIIERGDV